jgi:hypothetical protein
LLFHADSCRWPWINRTGGTNAISELRLIALAGRVSDAFFLRLAKAEDKFRPVEFVRRPGQIGD